MPLSDVPVVNGKPLVAGWFAVDHSEDWDRLILDRRPQNSREKRLSWLQLPLGCLFTRIHIHGHQTVRASGYDLSCYFTQLREHASGLAYQAVGRPFYGHEYPELRLDPCRLYVMCMLAIGMGDLNAVDIAQEVHLEVLRDYGAFHEEGHLRWACPLPLSSVLQGIYIDDGCIAGIVPRADLDKEGPDSLLVGKVLSALKAADLKDAPEKGFGAAAPQTANGPSTRFGCEKFVTWGTRVNGASGDVGTMPERRLAIALLLMNMVRLPNVERSLLERGLALLPHPFSHRKELMAFSHRIYKWCSSLPYSRLSKWAPDCRAELYVSALALFVADSNMRWPVCNRITTTDATPSRGGTTAVNVDGSLAKALWSASEHRGKATTLRASELPVDTSEVDPDLTDFYVAAPWEVTRSRNFDEVQHVNLQELAEIIDEVGEAGKRCLVAQRLVNASDSMVCIGCTAKGRSPSLLLNGSLRRHSSRCIANRKVIGNLKVGTADNPSDDPSREVELRKPQKPKAWLRPLLKHSEPLLDHAVLAPRHLRCFREAYAGCCELSRQMLCAGIPVGRPLEAYPAPDNAQAPAGQGGRGVARRYLSINDLDDISTRDALLQEAAAGLLKFLHLGIPCTGWASMNQVNGGTRTLARPEGTDPRVWTPYLERVRRRERKANQQAEYVADLCSKLHRMGVFFSIENPVPSHLWVCESFCRLRRVLGDQFFEVTFHQCAFGLTLPGARPNEFCRKSTRFWSNMQEIHRLERRCPGLSPTHQHVHAVGSAVVDGVRLSRAGAAGRYPIELCREVASAAVEAFKRTTWNGHRPWSSRPQ